MERPGDGVSRDYSVQWVMLHQEPEDGVVGPTGGHRRCDGCASMTKAYPSDGVLGPPCFIATGEGEVRFE